MTHEQNELKSERAFLHELCNTLAVSQGLLHMTLMKSRKAQPDLNVEDILSRVEKALESIEKANKLVLDRRAAITQHFERAKHPET